MTKINFILLFILNIICGVQSIIGSSHASGGQIDKGKSPINENHSELVPHNYDNSTELSPTCASTHSKLQTNPIIHKPHAQRLDAGLGEKHSIYLPNEMWCKVLSHCVVSDPKAGEHLLMTSRFFRYLLLTHRQITRDAYLSKETLALLVDLYRPTLKKAPPAPLPYVKHIIHGRDDASWKFDDIYKLRYVESLTYMGCNRERLHYFNLVVLPALGGRLRSLEICSSGLIFPPVIRKIAKRRMLESFSLADNHTVTSRDIQLLLTCTPLRKLRLMHCRLVSNAAFLPISCYPHLKELILVGNPGITRSISRAISDMAALEKLELRCAPPLSDLDIHRLSKLPALKYLRLPHSLRATDNGYQVLGTMTALVGLDLEGCE